jgi:acetylornithine deacetylase/succinyl-diaminopimelate desuccinylase-like protein
MRLRADALTTSSAIILAAEALANDARHHGTRITVGRIDVAPGSITTIAGRCTLHVDVRDTDSIRQRESASELIDLARRIAESRGTSIEVTLLADASPAVLPITTRNHLVATATDLGLTYRIMPSGASHDTQMVNHVCSGGMIFVPSLNGGVSHSPDEDTAFEDLAVGIDLLTSALVALAYSNRPEGSA